MFRKLPELSPDDTTIVVDGTPVSCRVGEMVAAVVFRLDDVHTRTTYIGKEHRAPFCIMGVCFDCLIETEEGVTRRSCVTPVSAGMVIRRHPGMRILGP